MKASKFTGVDFFNDMNSPFVRNRFFAGFALLIFVSIVLALVVQAKVSTGIFQSIIQSVLIGMISSSIIILFTYGLYIYFIGGPVALTEVVRPQDINQRVHGLHKDASYYLFWGRSASFFRGVPLRTLDQISREQKRVIHIEIMLPDPSRKKLLGSYQEILNSLNEKADQSTLLTNVLATSVTCAILSANNKYLDISLFYSKFLPAFRLDISDAGTLLTQDDPKKSALFFEGGSEFHEMFKTTFHNEKGISKKITWNSSLFKGHNICDIRCTDKVVGAFGLKFKKYKNVCSRVEVLVKNNKHRYK